MNASYTKWTQASRRLVTVGTVLALAGTGLVLTGTSPSGAATPPTFSVGDGAVLEGDAGTRTIKVPVTLSDPQTLAEGDATVQYTVTAGSASSPSDFKAVTTAKTLKFKPGVAKGVISVKVLSDAVAEGDETVEVALGTATGGPVVTRAVGTATIIDDDVASAIRVGIGDISVVEGDTGVGAASSTAQFTVSLAAPLPAGPNATVQYATAAGTATAGSDFTAIATKTLTFKPGNVSKVVTVKIARDVAGEDTETFTIGLSNPSSGLTIARATGTGTILDNDLIFTTATLATSPAPSTFGSAVTLGATITASSGSPMGLVEFYDGTTLLGSTYVSGGYAGITKTNLLIGTRSLTAKYIGDFGFASSTSAAHSHTVTAPGVPVSLQSVAAGNAHTCALRSDGNVKCWGSDFVAELGAGGLGNHRGDGPGEMGNDLPLVELSSERSVTSIATNSGGTHSCAVFDNDLVKCWGNQPPGYGDSSLRGDDPNEMGDNLPFIDLGGIGGGQTVTSVAVGAASTCAILDDGGVKCWGFGADGRLGYGDTSSRGYVPGQMGDNLPTVDLGTGRTAAALALGDAHSCALLDDATVKCWGQNLVGQLGQEDQNNYGSYPGSMGDNLPPIDLGTNRTATAIVAGGSYTCALLDDATVKCWGAGPLGYGDTGWRGLATGQMGDDLPTVDLGTGRTATAIAGGGNHVCVLLDDASLKCWGENSSGQLGLDDSWMGFDHYARGDEPGEMGDSLPAVDLGDGRTAVSVVGGNAHTCALLDDASLKCWGRSDFGQLGYGDQVLRGYGPATMGDALPAVDLGS